jgi:hypothetical protein
VVRTTPIPDYLNHYTYVTKLRRERSITMNETFISSNSTGNGTRRGKPYPLSLILFIIVTVIALAVGVTSALAQPGASQSSGSPSALAGPAVPWAFGDSSESAVAYNSANGDYLVVWYYHTGEYNWDIYGQRVSSSGALLGSEIPISTASQGQFSPAVAYNSISGEYLVVWEDIRGGTIRDIYGQRVSSSGALLGSEIPISTASGGQYSPKVAYNGTSGEYLVVWGDARNGTTNYDIYGQRVSSSGALLGSDIAISTASGNQYLPAVAYNSTIGDYLVAWQDPRSGNIRDIYGQRVSSSGALLGSEIPISTDSGDQSSPQVAYNSASGEYLVVWTDPRGSGDIYGQRVSGDGGLSGSEIGISTASGYQNTPQVAYNSASGEYLVVWTDNRNLDAYGQRVSGTGDLVGSDIPISPASGSQTYPAVAYNSTSGEYLVAWDDYRSGNSNFEIYGQRVSGGGALVGSDIPITGGEPGATPTATPVPPTATATPTPCVPGQFSDVPPDHTFYPYVSCLVDRGVMSGYSDCTFRPSLNLTRGQLAKVVSNAANFTEPHTSQSFEDVATDHTFYLWIERLASRGIIGGYACGGENEPCVPPLNRPYFRSGNNVTRGQTAKIVAIAAGLPTPSQDSWTFQDVPGNHTFWQWIEALSAAGAISGYGCGGEGEPCVPPNNRPYFRVGNNVTRGQASKVVANAFFPNCQVSPGR